VAGDRTTLRLEVRVRGVLAVLLGRVKFVSDSEIHVRGDNEDMLVRVPLAPNWTFWYRDMRDFPDLVNKYAGGLTLIFDEDNPEDGIVFAELREPGSLIGR
jgi:hypothetical protein